MPAPTSLSSAACSCTSTSSPRRSSASAAVSPPMPPPMTMILLDVGIEMSSLRPGRLHDLRPARQLLGDERGKLLRRSDPRLEPEPAHAGLHLGRLQAGIDRRV